MTMVWVAYGTAKIKVAEQIGLRVGQIRDVAFIGPPLADREACIADQLASEVLRQLGMAVVQQIDENRRRARSGAWIEAN